ncbi:hypothetical protein C4588_03015 [Candidatus Parcubacteria bacterium]|nr:MAG: hypothetical protein C4588_03015 [Candidatus Parcubacteria bacterium]
MTESYFNENSCKCRNNIAYARLYFKNKEKTKNSKGIR